MYNKVLVAMALDHGLSPGMLDIARKLTNPGGEIMALHVVPAPFGLAAATQREDLVASAFDRAKELMTEKLKAAGDITPKIVEGHVERSIMDVATKEDVDCIVIGSHAPDLADYLLGSTAARVVRHAPCAVHVYRNPTY